MRIVLLTFCLIATAQNVVAELCSATYPGFTCTPDPGEVTATAKKDILSLIERAQIAEPTIKALQAKYLSVRDNSQASSEEKYAACEPYHAAKTAQDQLYKKAMDKTAALYQV